MGTDTDTEVEQARRTARFERAHDPGRVHALSDGVCAIIITLLVLEVHVPEHLSKGESLIDELSAIRPSIVAFLISFVVVAVAWSGHRDLFAAIRRTDRTLVWLNLLYLLPLCLLPFGASLIARYPDDAVALRIYGIILVAVSLTRFAIWIYATGRVHLLWDPPDELFRRTGIVASVAPALAYGAAIAVAAAAPAVSMGIFAAVPVAYFVGVSVARSAAPPGSAERDLT